MSEAWLERWQEGRIGWHEAAGNQNLRTYWTATGRRVLVPLCGKTPDLLWLEQQGNEVVGVELSAIAAQEFFLDHDLRFTRHEAGSHAYFDANDCRIRIVCGDYFDFGDEVFDAIYDRAALVAMPRDRRPAYAAHTSSLLARDAYHLLVSLEYEQSLVKGPPYAVLADEIRSYWPYLQQVAENEDIQNAPPKFRKAGMTSLSETVFSPAIRSAGRRRASIGQFRR